MNDERPVAEYIEGPYGRLAYLKREGKGPGLVWLGGYASDMRGTKAEIIDQYAAEYNHAFLRFDYSGHGESDGDFEDGTISRWATDSIHAITALTDGPQILIGSSMGGWMAGLIALALPERIAGLVLIAPAPDFTSELTPEQWPEDQWTTLQQKGVVRIPSEFDDSVMVYTKAMFENGDQNRILDKPLPFSGPVRILSGMADDVVPWQHAVRYADHIGSDDVTITLVKNGDHRMSSEPNLDLLTSIIDGLLSRKD